MFGFRFVKFQPNVYVLKYKKGKIVREGIGLSFMYFAPTTSLVAVPVGSLEAPFIFEEVSKDFQSVSIQGQVNFRISDPKKIAGLLNYTLSKNAVDYISSDPERLPQRVITVARVRIKKIVETMLLKDTIRASDTLANTIVQELKTDSEIGSLGLEIFGVSVVAIKPNQETARALEAATREQILKEADDAIYARRNASVEQERVIKENELNTEIAVELKKRQILETQKDAEKAVQQKQHEIENAEVKNRIALEDKKRELVKLAVENEKAQSDAKAYGIASSMKALADVNPSVIQSLAAMGMQPEKLIAVAFQGLAENASKIGELNISPELLKELIHHK